MLPIIFSLYTNRLINIGVILLLISILINITNQENTNIKLSNKVDFILSKFPNMVFTSKSLNYSNKVRINGIIFFNIIELNKNRTMITNNTIEVKDCLIILRCSISFELYTHYNILKSGSLFEYKINKFSLSYNQNNNSFYISDLNISPPKYPILNEHIYKFNKEFMNDINNTNGLFYNFTYNLTYNHLTALCEDFDQLVKDFINILNIAQSDLIEETKHNITYFISFNTNYNEYFFTPTEGGILVNNLSFTLFNKIRKFKIKCNCENFMFGKKYYSHSYIYTNIPNKYETLKKSIYKLTIPQIDKIIKKSRDKYYGI